MEPIFDLRELATNYTINCAETGVQSEISVIDFGILDSIIKLQEETNQGVLPLDKLYKGFALSPWHVTWYAAPANEFNIPNAVRKAIREGNNVVIAEILPPHSIIKGLQRVRTKRDK